MKDWKASCIAEIAVLVVAALLLVVVWLGRS